MKRFRVIVIFVVCFLFLAAAVIAVGDSYTKELIANYVGVQLVVHGTTVTPKDANGNIVEPFIVDGTTYLPVRAVAEALGEEVSWDGATKTVYIGEAQTDAPEPAPEQPSEETGISLDQIAFSLYEGESKQVLATVVPQGTSVTWSSSNPEIATVDSNGVVTAITAGKIDIFATAADKTAFCTVTVMPCAISLDQIAFSMDVGQTKQVTATVTPQGTVVVWSSSNPEVASVDANGVVTAVSAGKVDIYAAAGSAKTFCTVTIVKKESITVGAINYALDSAKGIKPMIYWRNDSGKTIKYITFTVTPYNAVGDVEPSTVDGKTTCDLRVVGPVEAYDENRLREERAPYGLLWLCKDISAILGGNDHSIVNFINYDEEKGKYYKYSDDIPYPHTYYFDETDYKYMMTEASWFDPVWYSSVIVRFSIDKIVVEYMDGTTETIDSPDVWYDEC